MPGRVKRRLLNLLTFLSLLVCATALGVAIRGEFISRGETFGPQNDRVSWRFTWRQGQLFTYFCPGYVTQFSLYTPGWSLAGVHVARGFSPGGQPLVVASMTQAHVWVACLAFAVAPALYVRRRLREALRPPPGLCAACGYDLRASPDRCPECGSPASVSHGGS